VTLNEPAATCIIRRGVLIRRHRAAERGLDADQVRENWAMSSVKLRTMFADSVGRKVPIRRVSLSAVAIPLSSSRCA
jgi:hypothetical protein